MDLLGWSFLVRAMLQLLINISNFLGHNLGLSLIAFTILSDFAVRGISLLNRSWSTKAREIEPEIQWLREVHKKDPIRLRTEIKNTYRTHNISPDTGCWYRFLTALVRVVIFFALAQALTSVASFIADGSIPFAGEFEPSRQVMLIWLNQPFLWMSHLTEPDLIGLGFITLLPTVTCLLQLFTYRMTLPQNYYGEHVPASFRPMNRIMEMAIFIACVFFYSRFPAGAVLYVSISALLALGFEWIGKHARVKSDQLHGKHELKSPSKFPVSTELSTAIRRENMPHLPEDSLGSAGNRQHVTQSSALTEEENKQLLTVLESKLESANNARERHAIYYLVLIELHPDNLALIDAELSEINRAWGQISRNHEHTVEFVQALQHYAARRGILEKFLRWSTQALAAAEALGDPMLQAKMLHGIGTAYSELGEQQTALGYLSQALAIREIHGDSGHIARTLMSLAEESSQSGNHEQALKQIAQAQSLLAEFLKNAAISEADPKRLMSLPEKDLPTASPFEFGYWKDHPELHSAVGYVMAWSSYLESYLTLGKIYLNSGEPRKALACFEQILPDYQDMADVELQAALINNIGLAHDMLGDRRQALKYYERALSLTTTSGSQRGEFSMLNNIGLMHAGLARLCTISCRWFMPTPGCACAYTGEFINIMSKGGCL